MASIQDDVESLSSLNDSAWDMVDERSALSEDEGSRDDSRLQTPADEIPEPGYPEGSLAGNDTGSEGQDSHARGAQFTHSRKDSSSDPPDTARPLSTAPKRDSILLEDQVSHIRFREDEHDDTGSVSFPLAEFHGPAKQKLMSDHSLDKSIEFAGTVRQQMAAQGVSTLDAYKIVYVGATEMKETIVNKIASALATSPTFLPKSSMQSSRVTVVPISSFADDSSPDVVLIDSMGIDMSIEECKGAKEVKENGDIILNMTNGNTVGSIWSEKQQGFLTTDDYEMPDLAVVYVPKRDHSAAKKTQAVAWDFFQRHDIPVLIITYDTKWKQVSIPSTLDTRLPHLAIEAFNPETGRSWVLRRQPIDVNTFISIDSAQLSRSLALVNDVPSEQEETNMAGSFSKILQQMTPGTKVDTAAAGKTKNERDLLINEVKKGLKGGLTLLMLICIAYGPINSIVSHFNPFTPIVLRSKAESLEQRLASAVSPTPSMVTSTITQTVRSQSTGIAETIPKDILEAYLHGLRKESGHSNKTEKFSVQVIGDNHVLVFAPAWYTKMKTPPAMDIKVRRSNEVVPNTLTALHKGVYALRFPPEYAHGSMEIQLRCQSLVDETYLVDLGSSWLKIAAWQRAAFVLKDHASEDLSTARTGLWKAYSGTNKLIKPFYKDLVVGADKLMKEAEKLSLNTLMSTLHSTDTLLAYTKNLTTNMKDGLASSSFPDVRSLIIRRNRKLANGLFDYSKKMSNAFTKQAKSLTAAASGMSGVGQEIQHFREKHFVEEQKRLLQIYWNIFGMPQHLQAQLAERKQELLHEHFWTDASGEIWLKPEFIKAAKAAKAKTNKEKFYETARAKKYFSRARGAKTRAEQQAEKERLLDQRKIKQLMDLLEATKDSKFAAKKAKDSAGEDWEQELAGQFGWVNDLFQHEEERGR